MEYILSMDGGGTKTAWLLSTITGDIVAQYLCGGCSHTQLGIPGVMKHLSDGISHLLQQVQGTPSQIRFAAFGIPCYGEYPSADTKIRTFLDSKFPACTPVVCNDVELGFAGSLCLSCGIHLVAGTGAIAYGRDFHGHSSRSNGWHPVFSDEGSGYWLGMKTLSLYAKQCDGRIQRSALYDIIRRSLHIMSSEDLIHYFDTVLAGKRDQIAHLQLYLHEAALAGDQSAVQLYQHAAYELYLSVKGVYHTLDFSGSAETLVSYSGGIFQNGSLILDPLRQELSQLSAVLIPPRLSPVYGGLLLAVQNQEQFPLKHLISKLQHDYLQEEHHGSYKTRDIFSV